MQGNKIQQRPGQLPELTVEDNKAINIRADEMAKHTPKEEMRNIVEKMNPHLRRNLAEKSIDPIIYYFRMLAKKEFRQHQRVEGGSSGAGDVDPRQYDVSHEAFELKEGS